MSYKLLIFARFLVIIFMHNVVAMNVAHIHLFTGFLLLNNLTFEMLGFFTGWKTISFAIKYTMQLLTSVLCLVQLQGVAQGHLPVLHLSGLRVKLCTVQLYFSPSLFLCIIQGHKDSAKHYLLCS